MILRTWPALAAGLMLAHSSMPASAQNAGVACANGWAGTVQYSRNQALSDTKTEQRVSGKGTETTNFSMTYDYTVQVSLRAQPGSELSEARANITLASFSREAKTANDRHICPHERAERTMSGTFLSETNIRANGSGLEAEVTVTELDSDGRYSVSIILPEVRGTVSGSNSSSFSGQCTPREGVNQKLADIPTTIDGVRFSSGGEDRADPQDPNRRSGSYSMTYAGVTEALAWSLRRCGGSLRLVELKFADMKYPNWGDWQEISPQRGTIDGNVVRLTAVVANDGAQEEDATIRFVDTYKGDQRDGARRDGLLGEASAEIPPGEQREVHFEWDSSGFAWYDDGRPRPVQRIKAEIDNGGKTVDEKTENLKVAPKPVVLVHGLWSNWRAWESWQNILTSAHSYDWKAFPVGEKPEYGRMNTGEEVGNLDPTNTIAQNAQELSRYIRYAQRDRNAWHVDIVAHSMGGLISRRYIHAAMPAMPDGKPQVAHLVMLGTPNMGSHCADMISAPLELFRRSMDALRELRPSVVAQFNAQHTERKDVKFSVLAGNILPDGCYAFADNDGVVMVESAVWTIEDNEQQSVLHTDMTGAREFANFVKPRIALGPNSQGRGQPGPDLADRSSSRTGRADMSASYKGAAVAPALSAGRVMMNGTAGRAALQPTEPDFADIVKVAPGETVMVSVPVRAARRVGMTFVAANTISATLTDDTGALVGANLAGSPEASQLFRSISADRAIEAGTWTLTIQNTGETEREIVLSTWSLAD